MDKTIELTLSRAIAMPTEKTLEARPLVVETVVEPTLTRPRPIPRRRRSTVVVAAIACGSTVIGFGSAIALVGALASTPAPAPHPTVAVTPPASPPPEVPVVHDTDEGEGHVSPRREAPPRSPTPMLDARCMVPSGLDHCGWDTGMPAISEDGKVILRYGTVAQDGVTLELVDAATSKVIHRAEIVADGKAPKPDDEETIATATARLAAFAPAIAAAGQFHSLAYLGAGGDAEPQLVEGPREVEAMIDGDAARVESTSGRHAVLFQGRIAAERPVAVGHACVDYGFYGMQLWYDAKTNALVAEQEFHVPAAPGATDDDDSPCAPIGVVKVVAMPALDSGS